MGISEQVQILAKRHWLLVPLLIVGTFATGFQAIPIFTWLFFPLILAYSRQSWLHVVVASIVATLTTTISILGLLDGIYDQPGIQHPWIVLGFVALDKIIFVLSLAADKLCATSQWRRVLVFPSVWAGISQVYMSWGPFGDSITFSNTVTATWPALAQTASLGGRALIEFLIAMFGTVALELPTVADALTSYPLLEAADNNAKWRQLLPLKTHPVTVYTLLTLFVSIYGGAVVNIRDGSFYQTKYPDFMPETVPVGCVIGPGGIHFELQADHDRWLNMSAKLADAGAKIILWSEEAAMTKDPEDEASLLSKAAETAKEHGIYLAIAYDRIAEDLQDVQNKLVVFRPNGEIGIEYNKAYPVPLVEPQPHGERRLPYMDTPEFGRIGAGICFDYNFPAYIRQASVNDIDVMLQAAWSWGPIGTYHGWSNALRPIENGFTQFRCSSQSLSGVFENTANGLFEQHIASLTNSAYMFNLPLQKRKRTLYGLIGNTFGYASFLAGLGFVGYTLYEKIANKRQQGIFLPE